MAQTFDIVISIATGLALRAGYCDFASEPQFEPLEQEVKSDPGIVPKIQGTITFDERNNKVTKWDEATSEWIEVTPEP